MLLQEYF